MIVAIVGCARLRVLQCAGTATAGGGPDSEGRSVHSTSFGPAYCKYPFICGNGIVWAAAKRHFAAFNEPQRCIQSVGLDDSLIYPIYMVQLLTYGSCTIQHSCKYAVRYDSVQISCTKTLTGRRSMGGWVNRSSWKRKGSQAQDITRGYLPASVPCTLPSPATTDTPEEHPLRQRPAASFTMGDLSSLEGIQVNLEKPVTSPKLPPSGMLSCSQ